MSKALGKGYAWGLSGVLAALLMMAAPARAEVSADLSGTILVFPKVVWDGTRDTIIQIANTSNNMVHVRCFYVDAQPLFSNFPVGPTNPRRWQVTDFELWLTRQQPTHWVASSGRPVDPTDSFGDDGYGLDPGAIPPVVEGFEGELRCVQTDASGIPFAGNNLKGETVLRNSNGDVSKHNAVAILASGLISNDTTIRLDNPLIPDITGEANSCHNKLLLDHFVENPADDFDSDSPAVTTELTLVPCSVDYENIIPSRVKIQFEITDEMELTFSASTTVECWLNNTLEELSPVFTVVGSGGSVGTMFTKIVPVDLNGGVIGIAEETHRSSVNGNTAVAAWNLQGDGQLEDGANNFINGRFFPVSRYDATLNTPGGPVVDTMTIVDF